MAENGKKESDLAEPFILPSNKPANEKDPSDRGCCCKCCNCTWRKCGIITAVIAVLIGLVLAAGALRWYAKLQGEADSEDSEEWNHKLTEDQKENVNLAKSILDGEFLLVSFEKNYEDYLIGMGMPGFVAKLILSAKEVITYTEPRDDNGLWTIFTKTDMGESTSQFRLSEPFNDVVGSRRKVNYNTTCNLSGDKRHILTCDAVAKEPHKIIKSVAVFSRNGFIDTRTLVNEGITTKKYYERKSQITELHQSQADDNELSVKIAQAADEAAKQAKDNPFKSDPDSDDDFDDFK